MSGQDHMKVPHSAPCLGVEEEEAVLRVLRSGCLAQGPEVEAFEQECAEFIGRRHAIAVSSGTAALHLALEALGLPQRVHIALPSYGCASLITAVRLHHAKPALCDIGGGLNLDPGQVPPHAAAVILPHLFGAPAPIPEGLVIEDIAQSMGNGTGKASPVAVTSFYATKLVTTGEGGMVFTDDDAIAGCVRDRRDYDNRDDFVTRHNYKLTDLQAAIGRVQVKRLTEFLRRRREIAESYSAAFAGIPLGLPRAEGHAFFRYVVTTTRREELAAHLAAHGIEAKRPVYRPAHHYFGGVFPQSERAHQECLSLPIYPALVDEGVRHV
ncbi:MAG: DegT/DnrJ/EryC1/StrS family aminotransferase, partial [Candidatus Hydrogenedentes bacterium]|nr:DegT/DnrJ/EryC1/StrS family aminotransferase [Candidatus Hydrogenedentota bacterium]